MKNSDSYPLRERDLVGDDLINDCELENDEQYHQYLEKYVEFIPNDTE